MKVALITGASMGIGEAFARSLAEQGRTMVLVARSVDALHRLATELEQRYRVAVYVMPADLSQHESATAVYNYCRQQQLEVELLINCAGFSVAGAFADIPPERIAEMVQVNSTSLALLTRHFLPNMLQRKSGTIINVASLGGLQGVPGMGLYSATKSFVITFSEALAHEVRPYGIKVVALCPGFIATGLMESAGQNTKAIRLPISQTDVVVKAMQRAFVTRYVRLYPTWLDSLLAFSQRLVSRSLAVRLAAFFAGVLKKG
uniref:Oxidoreductase, short-chain dehydrogenase/reductase family n=1 Tax=Chlorobium chlorochromatii (strain CaD3) TaxID=340177 RepID=Q3ATQ2_CHLCH